MSRFVEALSAVALDCGASKWYKFVLVFLLVKPEAVVVSDVPAPDGPGPTLEWSVVCVTLGSGN